MQFAVVTPSYGRPDYLDHTIRSIVTQRGDFFIDYVVQDGGSGKDVTDILESWRKKIDSGSIDIGCHGVTFRYFVERDSGMYDAIVRGFARTSGDIMSWLNTDDMYHPFAFQTIMEVLNSFENVYWITGIPNSYNASGSRVGYDKQPEAYSRKYIYEGYYDNQFSDVGFNWIQQESTFWRRVLWERAGGLDATLRYAADFKLWQGFAQHADLVRVKSFLGGFRVHGKQITADPAVYASELPANRKAPIGLRRLKQTMDRLPWIREKYLSHTPEAIALLESKFGLRREDLVGRTLEWSFESNRWNEVWKLIL
jgi:glycosyltransferase involved in cell wall biosynthesis